MTETETPPLQFIDQAGKAAQPLPNSIEGTDQLLSLYRDMVLARRLDMRCSFLQRTGRIANFPQAIGHEAAHVGIARATLPEDVFLPTYREVSGQIIRGVSLVELFHILGGDERGNDHKAQRSDFPQAVPISTQIPQAVGVAYALKFKREPRAVLTVIGDGGSSKGDFYEGLNFAGVWKVPVVFAVINNGWAISMPLAKQTAARTLADKGVAVGIPGIRVDGNDVVAVYHEVGQALARARDGGGPTLIEVVTYRLSDHSTSDDAGRYRDPAIVSEMWKKDPVARLKAYLTGEGVWDAEKDETLIADTDARVQAAFDEYEATDLPPPEGMFDYLYAELPADLAEQREEVIRLFANEGKDDG